MIAANPPAHLAALEPDQFVSYLALCDDVVTIVSVAGLPPAVREDGRAVTRAYGRALQRPAPERWRAYHRAVTALLASCTLEAASALDFPAVAACTRLRAFLRENPDLDRPGTRAIDGHAEKIGRGER
jgi:hypothetical protein